MNAILLFRIVEARSIGRITKTGDVRRLRVGRRQRRLRISSGTIRYVLVTINEGGRRSSRRRGSASRSVRYGDRGRRRGRRRCGRVLLHLLHFGLLFMVLRYLSITKTMSAAVRFAIGVRRANGRNAFWYLRAANVTDTATAAGRAAKRCRCAVEASASDDFLVRTGRCRRRRSRRRRYSGICTASV